MGGLRVLSLVPAALALSSPSHANEYAGYLEKPNIPVLQAIHAVHPSTGPRIWQFRKESSIVLVLGTIHPLSESLSIDTRGMEAAISASDAVLTSPGVAIANHGGVFRSLMLWPSIRKLKLLEDDRTLRDALSDADYTRWAELKHRYHLRGTNVERMRPMYAAWKAHDAALRLAGVRTDSPVSNVITQIARKHRTPIVNARFTLPIRSAKQTILNFHIDPGSDYRCFIDATSSLQPWLEHVDEIGRAWAEGDIEASALRNAPSPPSRCWVRLTNDAIASTVNLDLDVQSRTHWVKALRSASLQHRVVFTTLPLEDLLDSKGMAAVLIEEGYIADAGTFFGDQLPPPKHDREGS